MICGTSLQRREACYSVRIEQFIDCGDRWSPSANHGVIVSGAIALRGLNSMDFVHNYKARVSGAPSARSRRNRSSDIITSIKPSLFNPVLLKAHQSTRHFD